MAYIGARFGDEAVVRYFQRRHGRPRMRSSARSAFRASNCSPTGRKLRAALSPIVAARTAELAGPLVGGSRIRRPRSRPKTRKSVAAVAAAAACRNEHRTGAEF
jgi:hypothetical protein